MNLFDQSYKEQAKETWASCSHRKNSSGFIHYFGNPSVSSLDIPQSPSLLLTSLCHFGGTTGPPTLGTIFWPLRDHGLSLQLPAVSTQGNSSMAHISFSYLLMPHSTTYNKAAMGRNSNIVDKGGKEWIIIAWQTTKIGYCASSSSWELLIVQHSSFDIQASCDVFNFFSLLLASVCVQACPPRSPRGPMETQNHSLFMQSISASQVRLLLDLRRKVCHSHPWK